MIKFETGQKVDLEGNYVFLDTETANRNQDICQIGAIVVSNGEIIDLIDEYVKPLDQLEKRFYDKHKIKPELFMNGKSFDIIWKDYFEKYIEEDFIFVAHNAKGADLRAIDKSLFAMQVVCKDIKYICTQRLAERELCIKTPSREKLCELFDIVIDVNHNALSDAQDCFEIFNEILKRSKNPLICEIYHHDIEIKREKIEGYITYEMQNGRLSANDKKVIKKNEELDLDFAGKTVVVSGSFEKYPRIRIKELEEEIERRGGKTRASVSHTTDILIIGDGYGPNKYAKALEYGVRIVDEETLYRMLESNDAID